jgi:hypothetical protein
MTGMVLALLLGTLCVSARAAGAPQDVAATAPLLVLQDGERYGLASADSFIARASLKWSRPGPNSVRARIGKVDAARLGSSCNTAPRGCYTYGKFKSSDFTRPRDDDPDRRTDGGRGFYLDIPRSARGGTANAPVYYERTERAITYWFFYGFSYPGKVTSHRIPTDELGHEGDWERITVLFGLDGAPTALKFHQHNSSESTAWAEACRSTTGADRCDPGGTHPVVYVAKGSHASYAKPGLTTKCRRIFCSVDIHQRGDGRATWHRPLVDVTGQPWYGFGGAWGAAARWEDLTGPLGPSSYK